MCITWKKILIFVIKRQIKQKYTVNSKFTVVSWEKSDHFCLKYKRFLKN